MGKLYNLKLDNPLGYIEEHVALSQFTDGGTAAGTYQMQHAIPVGAHVEATIVTNVVAFAGDTSAVITVGDGSDVDRYNPGTPSVFSSAAAVSMGVPSGTRGHAAAVRPTITLTSASDFGSITGGEFDIRIVYLKGM